MYKYGCSCTICEGTGVGAVGNADRYEIFFGSTNTACGTCTVRNRAVEDSCRQGCGNIVDPNCGYVCYIICKISNIECDFCNSAVFYHNYRIVFKYYRRCTASNVVIAANGFLCGELIGVAGCSSGITGRASGTGDTCRTDRTNRTNGTGRTC